VGTLLEVNGRGYWETFRGDIAQLQEIYQEIETGRGRHGSLNG